MVGTGGEAGVTIPLKRKLQNHISPNVLPDINQSINHEHVLPKIRKLQYPRCRVKMHYKREFAVGVRIDTPPPASPLNV